MPEHQSFLQAGRATAKPVSLSWSNWDRAMRAARTEDGPRAPWLAAPKNPRIGVLAARGQSPHTDQNGGFPQVNRPEIRSRTKLLVGYATLLEDKSEVTASMEDSVKAIARPAASGSLREAIRKARLDEAARLDITADHRDGEIARLELLKAELETVFAEIPAHDDRFNLTLVPSRPARLWVDLFTYAAVDESSGAYLFIRNSENGRRTLFSASNVVDVADRITTYVAHEIVRRERMEAALSGEGSGRHLPRDYGNGSSGPRMALMAFIIGLLTGVAGLFAAVWLSVT